MTLIEHIKSLKSLQEKVKIRLNDLLQTVSSNDIEFSYTSAKMANDYKEEILNYDLVINSLENLKAGEKYFKNEMANSFYKIHSYNDELNILDITFIVMDLDAEDTLSNKLLALRDFKNARLVKSSKAQFDERKDEVIQRLISPINFI